MAKLTIKVYEKADADKKLISKEEVLLLTRDTFPKRIFCVIGKGKRLK